MPLCVPWLRTASNYWMHFTCYGYCSSTYSGTIQPENSCSVWHYLINHSSDFQLDMEKNVCNRPTTHIQELHKTFIRLSNDNLNEQNWLKIPHETICIYLQQDDLCLFELVEKILKRFRCWQNQSTTCQINPRNRRLIIGSRPIIDTLS